LQKAFSNPHKAKWIIQGAGLIWFLGCFSHSSISMEFELSLALADSGLFTLGFLLGVFVLERIFSFLFPKVGNNWLLLIIPLLMSLITVWSHAYIQSWVFRCRPGPTPNFLLDHRYLRWAVLGIGRNSGSQLIAIVVSKLEQQEESQQREAMMNELSKEAELTQLRQQLQPHFLFNSLNFNKLPWSYPSHKKAREMGHSAFRISSWNNPKRPSEMGFGFGKSWPSLRLYLDIEKVRFGHRLNINFEIEEGAESLQLPQLLIQPLLENAIKYGLYMG